ncbi:hypothetical protein ACTMLW_24035, partial [Escherichia coli]|uniref:hypothetical protein n=1 Tax=Escherichia coli TaxID=562 RepID=UPI003F8943D5
SCAAQSAKGDDKFITTDFLKQCGCGFVEYFCAAKPQRRDLKAVQGAKRLVLQRIVSLFSKSGMYNLY